MLLAKLSCCAAPDFSGQQSSHRDIDSDQEETSNTIDDQPTCGHADIIRTETDTQDSY